MHLTSNFHSQSHTCGRRSGPQQYHSECVLYLGSKVPDCWFSKIKRTKTHGRGLSASETDRKCYRGKGPQRREAWDSTPTPEQSIITNAGVQRTPQKRLDTGLDLGSRCNTLSREMFFLLSFLFWTRSSSSLSFTPTHTRRCINALELRLFLSKCFLFGDSVQLL